MSKGGYRHQGSRRLERACPQEDRDQFIKDNAVAIVVEYEARMERLRSRITQLEAMNQGHRAGKKGKAHD